jgi:ParB/RepB/Spo0J family partition protein
MKTAQIEIRALPLAALVLSHTPIQIERRAQFSKDALQELAGTIAASGRVEHAITVRPSAFHEVGEDRYEIVDGERRFTASQLAGLPVILAEVRELTDEQVEEIQIVTGLQKEKLHELVEAEGYETLHKRGLPIEEIAHKCGKSTATVYARMKLLALCKEGREAVRSGKLTASVGLLVARIPIEKLQKEALKDFERGRYDGEPYSYREASQLIQRRFMLRLEQAPFPVDDAMLVKPAGPCGICPKNTISQPELFADVAGGAMCTDQACFASKKSAHVNRQVAEFKAAGTPVFRGVDAKKISPRGDAYDLKDGWVTVHSLAKGSVPKDAEIAVLQLPSDPDRLVQIVKQKDVRKTPPRKSTKSSGSMTPKAPTQDEALEDEFERRLFLAMHAKAPKELPLPTLVAIADVLLENMAYDDSPTKLYKAWGWSGEHGPSTKELQKLKEQQLHQFLFELMIFNANAASNLLEDTAKRMGIDAKKIRAEVKVALKPPAAPAPAPAKASKKKAGKK